MKIIHNFIACVILLLPVTLYAETLEEEAARRLPPVLYTLDAPEIFASGEPVTIKWSILGYHDDYKSTIAFFDCSNSTTNCGGSYSSNFVNSGRLEAVSQTSGNWNYSGHYSTLFNYEYTFTPKTVSDPTKIVLRIYRINGEDADAGKSGLSLLMPGKISDEYYDTSGRRIVKYIIPELNNLNQFFPETEISSRYDGTSENDFSYPGQCVWYVFQRLIELEDEGYFEEDEWDTVYDSIHGKSGRHAKHWIENWLIGNDYEVSSIPSLGSLAVWLPNEDNINHDSYKYGHIAFVEKVDSTGETFTVTQFNVSGNEQYNRATYSYSDSGTKLYSARYREPFFIKLRYKVPSYPDAWTPSDFN